MTTSTNLVAVHVILGALTLYIPTSQVGVCSLVIQVVPEIPRSSQWLGIANEPQEEWHLYLRVPDSDVEAGWYLWGQLKSVMLSGDIISAVPPLLAYSCHLPALRALVGCEALSLLLNWHRHAAGALTVPQHEKAGSVKSRYWI